MTRDSPVTRAERDARQRVASLGVDVGSMFAISNVFRVTNAVRNFTERKLLAEYDLSFSGFTVLWILWVWGKRESRDLAYESGISKSTLTGVVKTLERQKLVRREPHGTDGRRVFVAATRKGTSTMRKIFPRFNDIEAMFTANLSAKEKQVLTKTLRIILHTLDTENG